MAEKKTRAPVLDMADRHAAAWVKVKAYVERRLASMRQRNDSTKLDAQQTAALRGRIAELKNLSSLDREMPEVEEDFPD